MDPEKLLAARKKQQNKKVKTILKHAHVYKYLFEIGLPTRIIGTIMGVSAQKMAEVIKILKVSTEEIPSGRNKMQLRLLEIYSSWIADSHHFEMMTAGRKQNPLRILWKELHLHEFENFIEGVLAAEKIMNRVTFGDGFSENEKKLLQDIYDWNHVSIKHQISDDAVRELLRWIFRQLHGGTIPFPKASEFANRRKCYQQWSQSLILEIKKATAPHLEKSVLSEVHEEVLLLSDKEIAVLNYLYPDFEKGFTKKCTLSDPKITILHKQIMSKLANGPLKKILFSLDEQYGVLLAIREDMKKVKRVFIENELNDMALQDPENASFYSFDNYFFKTLLKPVRQFDFEERAMNCILSAKLEFAFELAQYSEVEVLKFRNFGKQSVAEVNGKLKEWDLSLGMNLSPLQLKALKLAASLQKI